MVKNILTQAVAMQVPQSAYVSMVILERALRRSGHSRAQSFSTWNTHTDSGKGVYTVILVQTARVQKVETQVFRCVTMLMLRTLHLLKCTCVQIPCCSSSVWSPWWVQRWSPPHSAGCFHGYPQPGAPYEASARAGRHHQSSGKGPFTTQDIFMKQSINHF